MELNPEKNTCPARVSGNEQDHADQTEKVSFVDLAQFLLSAKIDFVTFEAEGKCTLPDLRGTVCWAVKDHHKAFTVHDPTPGDLSKLRVVNRNYRVKELEVAVDFRPRPSVPKSDRQGLLERLMVYLFGFGLYPTKGQFMEGAARSVYRPTSKSRRPEPYNMRPALPSDQQLHGWRHEDAQVKAYPKKKDQGRDLAPQRFVARVEVRLKGAGLTEHGIRSLGDLFDFKFRRKLMPYFTHIQSAKPRKKLGKLKAPMREFMNKHYAKCNDKYWAVAGVGAFVGQGKGKSARVRLMRNISVNDRIGQALTRLEKAFANPKFVCLEEASVGPNPLLVRLGEEINR